MGLGSSRSVAAVQVFMASLVLFRGLTEGATQPNIVFILTDDQDNHMGSLESMQALQKYIVNEGTSFNKHYCTVALCCPSRANLWTGRLAHNTNVTDVKPPYGGYAKVVQEGINDDYLPIWMQNAGYNTYYVGKLWNAYGMRIYNSPPAKGFTGSDILLDPTTYHYHNGAFSRDGKSPVFYHGQYSTDVVAHKALDYLDDATASDKPFFLVAAPIAPHVQVVQHPRKYSEPPPAAKRHEGMFADYQIPRTSNFNPDSQSGVSWVKTLPKLSDEVVAYGDEMQRARLRALQSVDDMIEDIITKLENKGVLDNTYVIFSTDNGYHISQHRMHPGKQCGFETDINIPFMIRGPGIPAGATSEAVTSHSDVAPTIMQIAGQALRDDFDGSPIPLQGGGGGRTEHTQVEFWGRANFEGHYGFDNPATQKARFHHAYKAVRLIGAQYSLYYAVWCTNERELYDMIADPGQTVNLYESENTQNSFQLLGRHFHAVARRLDALTLVLKSCKADECRNPWRVLHPQGNVHTLKEALDERHDGFYQAQPKVSFSKCGKGYIRELEGAQTVRRHRKHQGQNAPGQNQGGGHQPGEGGGQQPGGSQGGGHHPGNNQGGGHQPGNNQGGGHHPGNNQGGGHQPGNNQGGGHQPGGNQGGGHHPGDNQGGGHPGGGHQGGSNQGGGHQGGGHNDGPGSHDDLELRGLNDDVFYDDHNELKRSADELFDDDEWLEESIVDDDWALET